MLCCWLLIFRVLAGCLSGSPKAYAASDPMRQPWPARSASVRLSAQAAPGDKYRAISESGFFQEQLLLVLRFFQVFISPADGDRCPMFPSCSQYGVEAIRRYGPFRGVILTSDRLLRCGREADYPLVRSRGEYRFFDPLEGNVLWH
ncbi:MAG: membrane protein insertion efficiency factor YidD [bacterium]